MKCFYAYTCTLNLISKVELFVPDFALVYQAGTEAEARLQAIEDIELRLKLKLDQDDIVDFPAPGRADALTIAVNPAIIYALWLHNKRIHRGMSRQLLSEKTGISVATLWRYEKAITDPNLNTMVILEQVLEEEVIHL